MRVRVRQGSESVVVLLPGGIPERELDPLPVDDDVRDAAGRGPRSVSARPWLVGDVLVLKDGRDVDLCSVGGERGIG